jgi:hypothetical protein
MIIEVEGRAVGDGPVSLKVNRFVDASFTADAHAVDQLLPSRLHPFRWTANRTAVTVMAADWEWRVGSLTLCRSGDIAVAAMATRGETQPPPLLPLLRGVRVGGRRDPFLGGSFILQTASTNRIARGMWNQLYGAPGFVADMRHELQATSDRFVCEESSQLVLDLTVSSTGKASTFSSAKERGFGIRDDTLIGIFSESDGTARNRFGRSSAALILGDHPVAQLLRGLRLSGRPFISGIWLEGEQRMLEPVRQFGPATARTDIYKGTEKLAGHLVASHIPKKTEIDQGFQNLPFDLSGEFIVNPREEVRS